MVTLPINLKFWTLNDDIIVRDHDIGVSRYQEKNSKKERPFCNSKRRYFESRGNIFELKNHRSNKLKDALKDLEEILKEEKLISEAWRGENVYHLFFLSGTIATLTVSQEGDLSSINYDKSICGKLFSENVVDVSFSSSYLIYSYNDANLSFFYAPKALAQRGSKGIVKFSLQEAKVGTVHGVGSPGRRFERKLSINKTEDMLLVWWETKGDEVYPWSPINNDVDRANFLVYTLSGTNATLLCYCRTELSPLAIKFSSKCDYRALTVEQGFDSVGGVTILSCLYEIKNGTLQRISVTSIPLEAPLTAHAYNPSETCLLLACNNGVLALHCESRAMTHVTKAGLIPTSIAWHKSGSLLALVNERGQIQFFDLALSLVRAQLTGEDSTPQRILDLGDYFRVLPSLRSVKWADSNQLSNVQFTTPCCITEIPHLLMRFANGPLVLLQILPCSFSRKPSKTTSSLNQSSSKHSNIPQDNFSLLRPDVLARQYIKHCQWDEAVNLFVSLNWETMGKSALKCLFIVATSLLKLPLNDVRENQIEAALSSFILSPVQFDPSVEDEFGPPVRALTRRFFFKLLRNGKIEKAYRLAIDLKDKDCFLHVHQLAHRRGLKEFSSLALQNARDLSPSSCSSSSSSLKSSGSSCDSRSSASLSNRRRPSSRREAFDDPTRASVTVVTGESELSFHDNLKDKRRGITLNSEERPPTIELDNSQISFAHGKENSTREVRIQNDNNHHSDRETNSVPSTLNQTSGIDNSINLLRFGNTPPVRLKSVKEEKRDGNPSDIMRDLDFSPNEERNILQRDYENAVFKEIADDEEGRPVKVFHFGVV